MENENNGYVLEAYLTNLKAYNEGELRGEYVAFPCSPETLNEVLERIGIGEVDEFGSPAEEWFVTDLDGNMPSALYDQIGEYVSLEALQVYGTILEKLNELGDTAKEIFEGLLEQYDILDAAANTLEGQGYFYEGIENNYDLGVYIYDNFYDGGDTFPRDKAEMYFDYDKFGQAMREEYDAHNENTIQEELGLEDYADDYEIGEAYINQILGDISEVGDINEYVDFEAFGRDCDINGEYIFTTNGVIEYSDCNSGIGEDLYEEIKTDLINKGILQDYSKNEISYDDEER